MDTENPPSRKNLVLVHLESISNAILWQYRTELSTIWRLSQESRYFTRFYTSSTSTEMSMKDIECGTSIFYDFLPRFSVPKPHPYGRDARFNQIFTTLNLDFSYKYYSRGFGNYFFGFTKKYVEHELGCNYSSVDIDELRRDIGRIVFKYKEEREPFMLHLNNNVTHMALDDQVTARAKSFGDRFKLSYLQLDKFVGIFLSMFAEFKLWDNTLFVLYGDHGDELWSHSLNKGYCHCIAPYASQTWTPLLIYDNGKNAGFDDRLTSAVDVRDIVLDLMFPGHVSKEPRILKAREHPLRGRNVLKERREIAFSQNLFAMQLEYADLEKALTKGYAATDGVYRLVVSSGGKRAKDGGLEFYYDRLDPTNSRNLLDFFVLGVDGDILSFNPPKETEGSDFALVFNPETVRHMIESYRRLRRELHEYVRAKERGVEKYRSVEYHLMPESAFKQARKRIRKDYDE
jgi:Predicted hydrolase of alkaline phosphatase superfamily